jgi:acetylornithine deacetylase/succinyl-diaminopimelate desuccinylase family protein
MIALAPVAELVSKERDRLLAFYQELVRVPSVWGETGPLSEAAELIGSVLASVGYSVTMADSGTEGMPMVIARLPGSAQARSLMFNGHMEVYPPSDSWSFDPFGGVIKDGKLYGQGAADMKGGTAAMTMACWLLGKYMAPLEGDVIVLAVPNHFEGGEGTRKAIRDGLTADYAINCEPSELKVLTGQRGILYLTIAVRGRAAHTTALDIGVNAIDRAAKIVAALGQMVPKDANRKPIDAEKIVNTAMIQGGLKHNLVPEVCTITVDIRFPPEQTSDDVLRDVKEAIAEVIPSDEFPVTVEPEETCIRNPRSSLRLSQDHPLVATLAQAHEAATGTPASYGFHPAWPDTPIFNEMGIPAVTYGPGSMECYWDDEYVETAEYLNAIATYCEAAKSLLAGETYADSAR